MRPTAPLAGLLLLALVFPLRADEAPAAAPVTNAVFAIVLLVQSSR